MTETPPEVPHPPSAPKIFGALRVLSGILSVVILFALLTPFVVAVGLIIPGPLVQEKTVIIPHGANTAAIGAQLTTENAVYAPLLFHIAARLIASNGLKAGEYVLPARSTPIDIVTMLREGRSIVRKFTVAEGLTSSEIVNLLNADITLAGSIDTRPAEGSLLPETYRYDYGDSRASLIARMQKAMQEKLNEAWASRENGLPLTTPHEVLIMASIVEKETGKAEERPRIAGVFYNRLRLNMRLQSDPTVIYALTKGMNDLDRPLNHDDLALASPINTYASDGLPPQPICNPGRAALEAVTHPEHNNFLYFVADGSGGHAFASDLATHNQNINRWHRLLESQP